MSECGIDIGFDRKIPPIPARECRAFYCILLGHQYHVIAAEREIVGAEAEMVGKRVRPEAQAETLQVGKEALRIADGGDRMQLGVM